MDNLWNETFIKKVEPTPKEILSIQANYLTEMTNGKLIGTIMTVSAHPYIDSDAREFSNECFVHSFRISSPSLGYSFTLLRLAHETMRIKPYQIFSNLTGQKYSGSGKEELESILKEIFGGKEVNDALQNLMSQSMTE